MTVSLAELLPVLPSVLSIVWILFRPTSTHFFVTQLHFGNFCVVMGIAELKIFSSLYVVLDFMSIQHYNLDVIFKYKLM